MPKLNINGRNRELDVDGATPLLWAIREQAGLTGTKYGCGIAQCGACTVLVDGAAVRSCSVNVAAIEPGQKITTIEGLATGAAHPLIQAWIALDVPQCGYCQTGMIMAAADLLRRYPQPTDSQIDEAMTNLCRCGTYQRVRAAIHLAAKAAK